jgi:hypothetical protein
MLRKAITFFTNRCVHQSSVGKEHLERERNSTCRVLLYSVQQLGYILYIH